MALFLALYQQVGFQRTAVNRHPALWSPDLPPVSLHLQAKTTKPAAVWLASGRNFTLIFIEAWQIEFINTILALQDA